MPRNAAMCWQKAGKKKTVSEDNVDLNNAGFQVFKKDLAADLNPNVKCEHLCLHNWIYLCL